MIDAFHSRFLREEFMSRFVFALLSTAIFVGMASAFASEARAAAPVCDVAACMSTRCKRAVGSSIQELQFGLPDRCSDEQEERAVQVSQHT